MVNIDIDSDSAASKEPKSMLKKGILKHSSPNLKAAMHKTNSHIIIKDETLKEPERGFGARNSQETNLHS